MYRPGCASLIVGVSLGEQIVKNEITHVQTLAIPTFVKAAPKQQFCLPSGLPKPPGRNPWYRAAQYQVRDYPSDYECEARLDYVTYQIEILWDAAEYQEDPWDQLLVADAVLSYREERDMLRDRLFEDYIDKTLREERARKRQKPPESWRNATNENPESDGETRASTSKPGIDKRQTDLPNAGPSVWDGIERRRGPSPKSKKKPDSLYGQKNRNRGRTLNISIRY
jgi:hypothetical protein